MSICQVLVVDQAYCLHPDHRDYISRFGECTIFFADDYCDALVACVKQKFDLVITSVAPPFGLELAKTLRTQDLKTKIALIDKSRNEFIAQTAQGFGVRIIHRNINFSEFVRLVRDIERDAWPQAAEDFETLKTTGNVIPLSSAQRPRFVITRPRRQCWRSADFNHKSGFLRITRSS